MDDKTYNIYSKFMPDADTFKSASELIAEYNATKRELTYNKIDLDYFKSNLIENKDLLFISKYWITFICYGANEIAKVFSKAMFDKVSSTYNYNQKQTLAVLNTILDFAKTNFRQIFNQLRDQWPIKTVHSGALASSNIISGHPVDLKPAQINFKSKRLPGPYRIVVRDTRTGASRPVFAGQNKHIYDRTLEVQIGSSETPRWEDQFSFDTQEEAYEFAMNLGSAKTRRPIGQYVVNITPTFSDTSMLVNRVKVNTVCGPAYMSKNSRRFNQRCLAEELNSDEYLNNNGLLEWADELADNDFDKYYYSDDNLQEDIEKHDVLNPKLFDENNKLKDEVRERIEQIVSTFIQGLAEDGIKISIKDIVLIGSNASYNYTKDSDVDVHIVANTEGFDCPDDLYPKIYSAYRSLFNKNIDIDFYGIPVELYVEIEDTPRVSNGIYSVRNNQWIKEPEQVAIPEINMDEFNKEFEVLEANYREFINSDDLTSKDVEDYIEKIYEGRQVGLQQAEGEYSEGNLIFKEFRNRGYLDYLKDLRYKLIGRELSLESLNN